ncbi:hypothetical protein BGZ65_011281 [Modicella reniformis]|uniref:Uncharacterized protein n=1 Tax=Modicella reniformis TaxID=1440133 RepID=A0A9P6M7N8_9FUNG|nr:hypothetical protein BGZ65_011281 [Modicella reniformis]
MFTRPTNHLSPALVALTAWSWISSVTANIKFASIPVGPSNPGATVGITWTVLPLNGTSSNTDPFNLILRAESGQRYTIQNGVPQALLQLNVSIPKEATGGKHSLYAYYSDATKATSSNQFNITGAVVRTTSPTPTATDSPIIGTSSAGAGTVASTPIGTTEDTGISGTALGGIIGGVAAFLLMFALIFFFRHRRLARERNEHERLDDTKESYSETSLARSGPPSRKGAHSVEWPQSSSSIS